MVKNIVEKNLSLFFAVELKDKVWLNTVMRSLGLKHDKLSE